MGSPSDGVMEASNHASASARAFFPLGTCSMLKYVNACAKLCLILRNLVGTRFEESERS